MSQPVASRSIVADATRPNTGRIWSAIPPKSPDFTGRENLLRRLRNALDSSSKASVLPQALHGMGGVGKTLLAIEYAHRFADRYDIVWWTPAEHRSLVLQSLSDLGQRLGLPATADLKQGAATAVDALAASPLRWLLVFDNADDPEDLLSLIPGGGGHVIITSRNRAWASVWDAIEVDVFDRRESIELIGKRSADLSAEEADRLADRLGDLPLVLDQAASLRAATAMSVEEFVALFDRHAATFRRPAGDDARYRETVAAFVKVAIDRLRADAPAAAELFEMFAYLGAEPISSTIFLQARQAPVSAPLRAALADQTRFARTVRHLGRYGVAKVDPDQRIQVHRLVQHVVREELVADRARQGRANVHALLATANPRLPDNHDTWPVHAELGPHVTPAGLIEADEPEARHVVLDQIRYLNNIGDLEGARRLGERAVDAWRGRTDAPDLGPDGELTLLATRHLAQALRSLGLHERARKLTEDTLDRFRRSPEFGPDHEHTLEEAHSIGVDLRLAGNYAAALRADEENVERHRRVFGDGDQLTLRARSNLAVNLRMLGDFEGARRIDSDVARAWQDAVGENHHRTLFVQANLARDLYGLGRYGEALELQRRTLPALRAQLTDRHPTVLLAARTLAVALRKTGEYAEALAAARENYRDCAARFGPDHEHALAAKVSYANSLRVIGELDQARGLAVDADDQYRRAFGDNHPLTLAAATNLASARRAIGKTEAARELAESTMARMRSVLGEAHGFSLCVATGLATDLALAGEADEALRLSEATLTASRRTRGARHPYTLACAVNAALDRRAAGGDAGPEMLAAAVADLAAVLGPEHPEVRDAECGRRAECDIEPPPT